MRLLVKASSCLADFFNKEKGGAEGQQQSPLRQLTADSYS
jgi:hypothetical protein